MILYQEYEPTPDNPCEIIGKNLLESGKIIRKIVPIKYVNDYARVCHENKQLKDRINKAIEYIENKIESDLIPQDISYENCEETEHNYYVNAYDLLNLLKEDNKGQNER